VQVKDNDDYSRLSWTKAINLTQNRPLWRLSVTIFTTTLVVVLAEDDDDYSRFHAQLADRRLLENITFKP